MSQVLLMSLLIVYVERGEWQVHAISAVTKSLATGTTPFVAGYCVRLPKIP